MICRRRGIASPFVTFFSESLCQTKSHTASLTELVSALSAYESKSGA